MRINIQQIPAANAVPTKIITEDKSYNAMIYNAGAVNVQIGEDPTTLQLLDSTGAFTAGVTLTPGQTLALIRWANKALYAASIAAGALLEVIIDAGC